MAICPWAVQKLLPENETQAPIDPRASIAHTAVDAPGDTRLWLYFGRDDVKVETHFYIGNDGTLYQMMDTQVEADANQIADKFAVSYETEDDGNPVGNPWTEAQLQTIIDLNVWLVETHPEIVPDIITDPRGSGLGWHSMWGFRDPLNTTGCQHNPWTNARCKTCPGSTRIKQFVNIVVPAIQARLFGEDDMFDEVASAKLDEVLARLKASEEDGPRWWIDQRMKAVDEYLTGVDGGPPLHERITAVGVEELDQIRRSVATLSAELGSQVERGVRDALADVPLRTPLSAPEVKAIVDEVVTGKLREIFRQV